MKPRTLSLYRLAFSAGLFLFLSLGAFGLHNLQSRRSANLFVSTGDKAEGEGDIARAVRSLRSALRLQPKSGDVRAKLGKLLFEQDDFKSAYFELDEVVRSDPSDSQTRELLAACAIRIRRYADAIVHLQYLIQNSDKAALFHQLGTCQSLMSDNLGAKKSFQRAIELDPASFESYLRYAMLLASDGQEGEDGAAVLMDQLVRENPDSHRAHITRAIYFQDKSVRHSRKQELEKSDMAMEQAVDAALKALQIDERLPEARRIISVAELARMRLDSARLHAEKYVELEPTSTAAYLILSEIEIQAGDIAAGLKALKLGIERANANVDPLLANLASALIDSGSIEEGKGVLERLRTKDASSNVVAFLDAKLEWLAGKFLDSKIHLERLKPATMSDPNLLKQVEFVLGRCYRSLGQTSNEISAFERSVQLDPRWLTARRELVRSLRSAGQLQTAAKIASNLGPPEACSAEDCIQIAELAMELNRSKPGGQQEWTTFEAAIARLDTLLPESIVPVRLTSQSLALKGESSKAISLLAGSLSQQKDNDQWQLGMELLMELYIAEKNWNEADNLIQSAKSRISDSPRLRLADAKLQFNRDRTGCAEKLIALTRDTDDFDKGEAMELRLLIAKMVGQVDSIAEAEAVDRLVQDYPDSVDGWQMKVQIAMIQRDAGELGLTLKKLKNRLGECPIWHHGRAAEILLSLQAAQEGAGRRADLNSALQHIELASQESRNSTSLRQMKAETLFHLGRTKEAHAAYLEAIETGESSPAAYFRTLQYLATSGEIQESIDVIRQMESRNVPLGNGLGRLASTVLLRGKDAERSLQLARKTTTQTEDPNDMVWLGQLLVSDTFRNPAHIREAEKNFRQALSKDLNLRPAWLELAELCATQERSGEISLLIEEARRSGVFSKDPILLALIIEKTEGKAEAKRLVQEVLKSESAPQVLKQISQFFLKIDDPSSAQSSLEKLLNLPPVNSTSVDQVWARRNLAIVHLRKGRAADLDLALDYANKNLSLSPDNEEDLRVCAMIHSRYGTREGRLKAIQHWQKILEKASKIRPTDHYQFAELYLQERNWPQASRALREAIGISEGEDRSRFSVQYIKLMLSQNELEEAEIWVDRLASHDPSASRNLRAELFARKGQIESAIKLVREGIMHDPIASKYESLLEACSRLEFLSQVVSKENRSLLLGEAETILANIDGDFKGKNVKLCELYLRGGKLESAIRLFENTQLDDSVADSMIRCLETLLYSENLSRTQISRLGKILETISRHTHRNTNALILQAAYFQRIGESTNANRLYDELYRSNPNNLLVLNNYALALLDGTQDLKQARELADKSIELAGRQPSLLDTRATIDIANRDYDSALKIYAEILPQSTDPVVSFHFAVALDGKGQTEAAKESLQVATSRGLRVDLFSQLEKLWYQKLNSLQ